MTITGKNWKGFLDKYSRFALGSSSAARRMMDDDFRSYWYSYENWERAIADGGYSIPAHHAMGSVLQELSNWRLYKLDEELMAALVPDRTNRPRLPIEVVRAALAPVRALSVSTIAEAEARLGSIPALEAVQLLDEHWLTVVATDGRESAKTSPEQLARQRQWFGNAQEAHRITIGDVAVDFTTVEIKMNDLRAATTGADFMTARSANNSIFMKAFGVARFE